MMWGPRGRAPASRARSSTPSRPQLANSARVYDFRRLLRSSADDLSCLIRKAAALFLAISRSVTGCPETGRGVWVGVDQRDLIAGARCSAAGRFS